MEFIDHQVEGASELGLYVIDHMPELAAAIEALEGAYLIEVTERPRDPLHE